MRARTKPNNPLRRLKGGISEYLPEFKKIAYTHSLNLTHMDDIKWAADIYLMTMKPTGRVPVKRGLGNIQVSFLPMLLGTIAEQNGLDPSVPRERNIMNAILIKSVNEN